MDPDVLARAAANCGEAYRHWAETTGRPHRSWDDVVAADAGLPVSLPPNSATLLEPLRDEGVGSLIERVRAFFDGSPGGGYQIWSAWPTPDLSPHGFGSWSLPCLIRPPGGESPSPPRELTIVEAGDDASMFDAAMLLAGAFDLDGEMPAGFMTPALVGESFRVYVGYVDDQPVSTSAVSASHGFNGVYAVATAAHARGRGYGEALSWVATRFRPDLPATLQASGMGQPVYERMGYEVVAWMHNWSGERRSARRDP